MVGCSEFTRRNYLKSCAEAGMVDTSQGLPNYQQSTRFSTLSIGTPIGITSRAYKSAGSLPKSFSRGVGSSHLSPSRLSREESSTSSGSVISGDDIGTSSISPRPRRSNNFNRDRNTVITNPFKLETDSIESYIRSRKPMSDGMTEKSDMTRPVVETTFLETTMPTYKIGKMPLRNLEELRETIAIRRNYSKDRHLGNTYSQGMDVPEPTASLLLYSSRKSEEPEGARTRFSASPFPSPSRSRFQSEEKVKSDSTTNLEEKISDQ